MRDLDLNDVNYQPERLLRRAAIASGASSISDFAVKLGFTPANLSRTINRRQGLSGDLIVAIMDATGWPLSKVRELAGIPFSPARMQEGVPASVPSACEAAFIPRSA